MNYKELLKKALAKKKFGGNFNSFANSSGTQAVSTGMQAASGAINSKMDWKMSDEYSVADNPAQKTTEGVMGAIPVANMFMGVGKIGEAGVDSFAPGIGETIFSPHKKYLRMWEEKKPEYGIPVVGSVMAANDAKDKAREEKAYRNRELNPYGDTLMKNGGNLGLSSNDKLIEYNAPSHEKGGQMVDANGKVTSDPTNAVAEIEKKETSHEGYVFSDTLKHSNGKTFAAVSKVIDKKFKNKKDEISKKTREVSLSRLKAENEKQRIAIEGEENLPQKDNGGEINPTNNPDDIYAGDMFFSGDYFNNLEGARQTVPNQVETLYQADGEKVNYTDPSKLRKPIDIKGIENYQIPNYINMGKATPINEEEKQAEKERLGMNYLTPARIGKGVELAGKAGILAGGYDKVKPEFNLEKGKVKALMRNRRVNSQALLNEINLNRNAALASNQNARSMNVKRALDTGVYNRAARQAMQAKLQENSQNNAYRGQEASTLAQLGTEEKQDKVLAADLTARNKGQWLTNLGTVLGDVGRAGAFETKVKVNQMQITEGLAMLGNKYTEFGIDEATYKRLMNGKYTIEDANKMADSVIKFKQTNVK